MIHTVLNHIRDLLNENFRNEFSISENKLVISNIIKSDGTIPQNIDGKVICFLVNLDEESTLKNNLNRAFIQGKDSFAHHTPTLHLNIHLVFCANFDSTIYLEGLSYLSSLIRFFQVNKKLAFEFSGDSSHKINSLNFELCKLDFAQLSHLWSAIGSKLMPFVLYKVGILVFDDMPVERLIPVISESDN